MKESTYSCEINVFFNLRLEKCNPDWRKVTNCIKHEDTITSWTLVDKLGCLINEFNQDLF